MDVSQGNGFLQILHLELFLPQGILFCGFVIFLFVWLRRNSETCSKSWGRPVPELKIRFYNPYGHLSYLPTVTSMDKMGIPSMSYVLQAIAGNGKIFQKEGLFGFKVAFHQNVVLVKAELVEKFLTSNVSLEKSEIYQVLHPWLGTGLLTSHGGKWKSRRKLLTPSFHFDILREFMPVFNEQSNVLVNILKEEAPKEWVDIVHLITLCSLDIMCETILGVHVGAQNDSSLEYVKAVFSASEILMRRFTEPFLYWDIMFWLSSAGRKFRKDLKCLHSFTRKVIQQKKNALKSKENGNQENSEINGTRRSKRKALMDLLLDLHMSHQEFTEEDIREEIDTFAFEGHDTTSMGMSWALYVIGLYPDVQCQIHEELDLIFGDDRERPISPEDIKDMHYLERVLKESQRLYPSVPFFGRKINQDFDLCGFKIKKGNSVVVNNFVLSRNSDVFPNPEKFDPDRFLPENCTDRNPFAFVPFSAGSRNCIGQRFAMMEEKTVIANVLRNFSMKSLEHRDRVIPAPELILRTAHPLKVKFTPRDCSP